MNEEITKVYDGDNEGCLFIIIIVLLFILLQLNAIRNGLKDTFQHEKPVDSVEVIE